MNRTNINEASDKEKEVNHYEEANKLIAKIRQDINKLGGHFKSMGVNEQTMYKNRNPLAVLDEIDETLHGFDRTQKIFSRQNEMPHTPVPKDAPRNKPMAQKQMGNKPMQEMDNTTMKTKPAIKVGEKSDSAMKKNASDMAKKYDMDVQILDEISENIVRNILRK